MSHDDDRDDKPEDLGDITSFFAARAAEAAEHTASCTAAVCHRCDRFQCVLCRSVFPSDSVVAEHCDQCRTAAYRKAWYPKAVSEVPRLFAATTLDEDWLSSLVGHATISKARRALSAPRAAFIGPAGAGKTSLAIAMFRAALIADAPKAPRSWRFGGFPDGFGAEHLYVSAFALAKARGISSLGKESDLIERALRAPLVLLDELGGEDPRYASAVTEVIYERHAAGLRTWVTTGVRAKEIAQRYGGGIARKVLEDAAVFDLSGPKS